MNLESNNEYFLQKIENPKSLRFEMKVSIDVLKWKTIVSKLQAFKMAAERKKKEDLWKKNGLEMQVVIESLNFRLIWTYTRILKFR